MNKELLKGMTEEQIEKASHCKNMTELLSLAKEEGVELSDEQLRQINGGCHSGPQFRSAACPQCGTMANGEYVETTPGDGHYHFICPHCGYDWNEK
jgi:hypothetical protein